MCQYSSEDGFANDWHLVHLGSRAAGGVGALLVEATAVVPEGRISPQDLGIWKDEHIENLARIVRFSKSQGAVPGIQLAHAGRKASVAPPWGGGEALKEEESWQVVAPSPLPFSEGSPAPRELSTSEVKGVVGAFAAAAVRARKAGFEFVEIHAAHGYLLNSFLSPLTNHRTDEYADGKRLLLEVIDAVRAEWSGPLFLRVSATDWVEGGWTIEDTVALAKVVKDRGIDLIDCSSGGNSPAQKINVGPGYQVGFAARVRREADIPTGAVGMITNPQQAETVLSTGQADVVLLARELLRNPYWALHAAKELRGTARVPKQYQRAF